MVKNFEHNTLYYKHKRMWFLLKKKNVKRKGEE